MKRPLAAVGLLFAVCIFLAVYSAPPEAVELAVAEGETILVEGNVSKKEKRLSAFGGEYTLIWLNQVAISGENKSLFENKEHIAGVLCYMEEQNEAPIGSRVVVRGKAQSFAKATNPGQFDSKEYYHILGMDFKLIKAEIVVRSEEYDILKESLYQIKQKSAAILEYYYTSVEEGIMKTVLLGDKDGLDEEVEAQYKRNGIIHIMAISGLHISMLGVGMYKLLGKLHLPRFVCAAVGISFICCYGFMTGMSASTMRAIIMFVMKLLADIIGRTYDMLTALSFAAILILCEQPLYVRHCGFLLSFGAILGIAGVGPILKDVLCRKRKKRFSLLEKVLPGISIFLVCFPIQIYYYFQYPIYSLFLNLLIVPLLTVVMCSGLAVVACGWLCSFGFCVSVFDFFAKIGAVFGHVVLNVYSLACEGAERLPGAVIITGQPSGWQIGAYYCFLLVFLVLLRSREAVFDWRRGWRVKRERERGGVRHINRENVAKKIYVCNACLLPIIGLCILLLRVHSGMAVTFLDVGQGDCIYMRSETGNHYLIDGGSTSESLVGEYRITPFLKSQGVGVLEAVFLSHADADHCSGVLELLQNKEADRIRIKKIVLPIGGIGFEELLQLAKEREIPVQYVQAGDVICDGNMRMQCLNPSGVAVATGEKNEQSEVFYVTYRDFSMLLTGDVTGQPENAVRQQLEQLTGGGGITVLKVAHHGSRYSTNEHFLEVAGPTLSVISCGAGNSYGHPHEEVLERLEEAGSIIMTTPECGAVMIEVVSEGKFSVSYGRKSIITD